MTYKSLIGVFFMLLVLSTAQAVKINTYNLPDSIISDLDNFRADSSKMNHIRELFSEKIKVHSQPNLSLNLATYALNIAQNTGDIDEQSYFYHIIAITYLYMSDYENGMKYNLIDLDLCKQRKDTIGMVKALDNMAIIPFNMGDYENALKYYLRGLKLAEMIECNYLYYLYTGVGKTYLKMEKYDKAEAYFTRSLDAAIESKHENGVAMSYYNLSKMQGQKTNYPASLEYAFSSVQKWKSLDNKYSLADVYNHIASVYLIQKKFMEAKKYAEEAKLLAEKSRFPDMLVKSLETLSMVYADLHEYDVAFKYQQQFAQLKDQLMNEQKLKEIKKMETHYEIQQAQHELELLDEKNKSKELEIQKSNYLNYLLIALVLISIICAIFFIKQYKSKMREKNILLERKLLRAQMNPHFIFNSLTAIQSFLFESKAEEAARFLSMYAELMRLILESSRQEYITLEKEIKTLRHYLELQKLRFENKIDYNIIIDKSIPVYHTLVPPMLAQPFLENSLEHGFKDCEYTGIIQISIRNDQNSVSFEISDNGIGREKAAQLSRKLKKSHQSLATRITNERLAALNRQRKEKIRLSIVDLKNDQGKARGTKIVFTLPKVYGYMNQAV